MLQGPLIRLPFIFLGYISLATSQSKAVPWQKTLLTCKLLQLSKVHESRLGLVRCIEAGTVTGGAWEHAKGPTATACTTPLLDSKRTSCTKTKVHVKPITAACRRLPKIVAAASIRPLLL